MMTYAIIGLVIGVISAGVYIACGDYDPEHKLYNILEVISRILMGILIIAFSVCLWAPTLVGGAVVLLLACACG